MDWNTIISYIFDNLPAILSLIFVWVKLNKFGENINKTGLDAAYLKGNFDNHIKEHKKIPISLAKSKTALTDRGNKILKESGVEQYLKDNFDALYEQLKDYSKGEGETFKFRIRSRLLNRSYQTQWEYLTVRTNMEAPQNLEGDWIGGAVDITWDKVVGADDYVVEYCVRSVWHSADEVHIRDEGSNKKATRITIPSKLYADNSIEYINVRVRATRTQLTPNGAGQLYNGEPTSSEWSQVTDESGSVSNDLDIPIERS